MDQNTVFGGFRVDRDGVQIAHKMLLFQGQDGKKVIVWPEELAPGKAAPDAAEISAREGDRPVSPRRHRRSAVVELGMDRAAQPPIRIGASASKTGAYAAVGQNQLRGDRCVKHTNKKGGVRDGSSSSRWKTISPSRHRHPHRREAHRPGEVDLVLGPLGSPMGEPVYERDREVPDADGGGTGARPRVQEDGSSPSW